MISWSRQFLGSLGNFSDLLTFSSEDRCHVEELSISDEDCWSSKRAIKVFKDNSALSIVDLTGEEMCPCCWSWKVDISLGLASMEDWSHEDVLSEHELVISETRSLIVGEVEHESASEWTSQVVCVLHELQLVISKSNMDLHKLLEEENGLIRVVDLIDIIRDI